MACYHLIITGPQARTEVDLAGQIRARLSEQSASIAGFRHAGAGWQMPGTGCVTAVLADSKKDLQAALKGFDWPKGYKLTIESGDPLTDLEAEDAAIAALGEIGP